MKTARRKFLATANAAEIAATLEEWRRLQPGAGVLGLVSEHEPGAVAMLQEAANANALPLAGAVVPGLIADGVFSRRGMLLLMLDSRIAQTIVPLPDNAAAPHDAAADELAAFVDAYAGEDGSDTLLLFLDAMIPDIGTLLDHLYLQTGDRVRYAGANTGSETFKPLPCIFDNTTFVNNAVLALLLPKHPGAVLAHRYCGAHFRYMATNASGNRIEAIDGRPAFAVYRELVAQAHGVELTRENFYQHAVRFPLALHMAAGEPLVRIVVAVEDDDSLYCVGEVPESALLSIAEAAPPGDTETAQQIASRAREHAPAAALAFYCAGRLLYQGEEAAGRELAALQETLAPAPVFGALSLGEVGNFDGDGYPRFHNASIAALPWS